MHRTNKTKYGRLSREDGLEDGREKKRWCRYGDGTSRQETGRLDQSESRKNHCPGQETKGERRSRVLAFPFQTRAKPWLAADTAKEQACDQSESRLCWNSGSQRPCKATVSIVNHFRKTTLEKRLSYHVHRVANKSSNCHSKMQGLEL